MHARTKTGLRSISRAEQRAPAAKNRQFCPAVVKRNDSSQTQGQNARFFALSEAHTRTTDKNVRFSLPRPRKTVCFDRQRPKPTVFRIAHPTDSQPHSQQATLPSPISAMEGFFARLKNADNGNRVLPPSRLVRRDDSQVLPHPQRLPQALQ